MAFKSKDLSVLAYANGFTLWHYTTVDTLPEVKAAGYFNPSTDMVRAGDMLHVNADTDATVQGGFILVDHNRAGVVGIADLVAGV